MLINFFSQKKAFVAQLLLYLINIIYLKMGDKLKQDISGSMQTLKLKFSD